MTVFLYFGSTVGHIKHGKFAYKDKQDVVRLSRVSAIRSHCVSSSISIAISEAYTHFIELWITSTCRAAGLGVLHAMMLDTQHRSRLKLGCM